MNRAAILTSAAALALTLAPAAQAFEMTYGSYTSPTQTNNREGILPTIERITEATNGELTFETFTGGAMGGPKELLGNVGSGILDSASVVDIYVKSSIPVSAMLSSMMPIGGDPKVMAGAMNEMQLLNCPECVAERERNNVLGLSFSAIAAMHIICREPKANLADFQGVKISAPSGLGPGMQAIGATPVSITTAEMYEALNRGQIDCVIGSPAWLDAYNLKDFAQSVTTTPVGDYFGVMNWAINLDVWNDLTPEMQAAFKGEMAKGIGDILWAYVDDNEKAMAAFEEKGGRMLDHDEAFLAAWKEQQDNTVALTVEKGRADGIENAQEIVDTFLGLVAKWEKIVADGEGSKEHYIEALQREVFDRI